MFYLAFVAAVIWKFVLKLRCSAQNVNFFFYLVFFETLSWKSFVMHLTDVDLKFKGLTIYFHFLHSKDFFCDGKKWVFDIISVCLNCYWIRYVITKYEPFKHNIKHWPKNKHDKWKVKCFLIKVLQRNFLTTNIVWRCCRIPWSD